MKVNLSEKSKAEFIDQISKQSLNCWFEGDEFVMPSGQGKASKGIVLYQLSVWQLKQDELDEKDRQLERANEIAFEENSRANKLQEDDTRKTVLIGKAVLEKEQLQARIKRALGLIQAWDDQSYRDDADQLINVDLVKALRGEHE